MKAVDWAWGVDVRTGFLAFAALSTAGELRTAGLDLSEEAKGRGAARLAATRQALLRGLPFGLPAPTAIVVENPTVARTDFRLLTLTGVVMEALASVFACPILELTSGQWKKEVVGCGNADKGQVMRHAVERLGYVPAPVSTAATRTQRDIEDAPRQDKADAACVARAALNRVNDLILEAT